jgi:drug/metabolite transporter (DMT)-like permease
METNKKLLAQAIKYILLSVPLLFLGPSVIYNAFMNKQSSWHYLVLVLGIGICVAAMYYLYAGLKKVIRSLFND